MTGSDAASTTKPEQPPKWLVMVYMQAGDTSQLDNLAILDLLEMEAGVRENPNVQVLVHIQRRWPAVPQRYLLKSGALPRPMGGPRPKNENDALLNMGTTKALAEFLNRGSKEGRKTGAKKYCLVLWGHSFGLGFGRDHGDALHLSELQKALGKFRGAVGRPLDILATNSCTMGYIEAAYELKEDVKYLAASQVFVPLKGLPYKEILTSIDSQTEPDQLGRNIVDRYFDHFVNSPQGERVAMALLDLEGAGTFSALLNGIAETISKIIGGDSTTHCQRLAEFRDAFLINPAGDVRPVLDLGGLAGGLRELADDLTAAEKPSERAGQAQARTGNQRRNAQQSVLDLQRHADRLATAIAGPAINDQTGVAASGTRGTPGASKSTRLVMYHKEHPDLGELSGIGVFAPFVVDKEFQKLLEIENPKPTRFGGLTGRQRYERLKIFTRTKEGVRDSWPKLVYDTLRREEPDEIVDGTGVVRPADRRHVNQLLVAIEAAFNRLDRVLQTTERALADAVVATRGDATRKEILRTFGPPRLKLAGELAFANPAKIELSGKKTKGNSGKAALIVPTLAKIERTVQLVEKTCKGVVTNRTFGLGPPSSKGPTLLHLGAGPKEAGEVLGAGPKEAGEVLGAGPKEAGEVLGAGPKEAGEVLGHPGSETGAVLAFLSSDAQVAGLAVSTLLTQVALALSRLERAAAAIEAVAAQFLFAPAYGALLLDEDYERAVGERFERTFGLLKEASLQARGSIRRILAHPLYGLGPGPEDLGQEERDQLAAAAGLNRRNLRLL